MKKGFTLLEILVAITLFAVMTVFLTQLSRLAFRQNKKMSSTFEFNRKTVNVLDILYQDFNGLTIFFDFNRNMNNFFRIKDKYLKDKKDTFQTQRQTFFIFNPEFDFVGKSNEIEMTTFSLAESYKGQVSHQLMHVRYFLDKCMDFKTEKETECLIRTVINIEDDKKVKEKYILFRGVESLKFSYKEKDEWNQDWNSHVSDLSFQVLLPLAVRMDIVWSIKDKKNTKSYFFPVTNSIVSLQGREPINALLAFIRQDHEEKGVDIDEEPIEEEVTPEKSKSEESTQTDKKTPDTEEDEGTTKKPKPPSTKELPPPHNQSKESEQ